jgi:hypothetical protein
MTTDGVRWVLPLIPVVASLFAARGVYHIFQLESYQFPGYSVRLRATGCRVLPRLCAAGSVALFYVYDRVSASGAPRGPVVTRRCFWRPRPAGQADAPLFYEKKAKKEIRVSRAHEAPVRDLLW